ncbi:3-hydroxyacyl-ACP dehydratase FabZ [Geobacillus sp. TFV-3]|uniref:3-hydroxyacyl-ACP dehydratase FabZ n=1 Tax=Geobacillus sp. TFV-3 TaxID=1897059 RepID=UPI00135C3927|nr:3-hydroxyacyl-ACP dehydratase FabZ [Geobacillus sp. TFV-3]KAF0995274.1 3-hydroxyacyl-[acyl-carrier-protein] dehydratase FabZ [Geobacillus sp. TFV-3]
MSNIKKASLSQINIDEIKKLLPHQYPFLLIDRVVELEPGKYGKGIKNVTINEPFFQGHFPQEAIMPGVLMVEAIAQLIAIVYISKALEENDIEDVDMAKLSERVGYLVALKNIKFKSKVVPGDQLVMYAKVVGKMNLLSQVQVWAEVEGRIVLEGMISVSEKNTD